MTTQTKRIMLDVRLRQIETYDYLELYLTRETVPDWCLGLVLLAEGLVDSLIIINSDRSLEVDVSLNVDLPYRFEMVLDGKRVHVRPSAVSLRYWLSFGLKYYRDGAAETMEVDDKDIDAEFNPRHGALHLFAQDYRSMTLEEAERRFFRPLP